MVDIILINKLDMLEFNMSVMALKMDTLNKVTGMRNEKRISTIKARISKND